VFKVQLVEHTLGVCMLSVCLAIAQLATATTVYGQTTQPGWTSVDVGSPPVPGTVTFGPTALSMTSRGLDVAGTSDQFRFTYRPITGNATVIARVNWLQWFDSGAAAGVMIRESLQPTARHAVVFATGPGGVAMKYRTAAAGATSLISSPSGGGAGGTAETWLKITRAGNVLTTSRSADGVTWTLVGTATVFLPSTAYVGLTLTSRSTTSTASAQFTDVKVIGNGTLDAGFSALDVGTPILTGGSWSSAGAFVVDGAGTGIAGVADQFRYVYRQVSGDMDLVTRVAALESGAPGLRAGVMVRKGTTAGSDHISLLVTSTGLALTKRTASGALAATTSFGAAANLFWLKVSRRGTTVTASSSTDGLTWTQVGTQTVSDPYYVGLAVTSTDITRVARAQFDNTLLTWNQPPTVTMSSPTGGITLVAPTTINVAATATDADGTISSVEFYSGSTRIATDTASPYQTTFTATAPGTYTFKAIARDSGGKATTSTTRSVTVIGNSAPTVSLSSPQVGQVFELPASIVIAATAADANGTIQRVEFYDGAMLLNVDTLAPYSFTWTAATAGSHSLRAVAYDNAGASTHSTTRTITVSGSNDAPTISLTSPQVEDVFDVLESIVIAADAEDVDGTIQRVEFYDGTTLIQTVTAAPYFYVWQNPAEGAHAIRAVAYDDDGGMTVSSTRDVVVVAAPLPTKAVFTPSSLLDLVLRYVLEIFPTGADPSTANPTAIVNLGLPPIFANQVTVDISSTVIALPPGQYFATVSALSLLQGELRSEPSPPFTR
jgi:regulation of enolase protein 1 (concanavalin A-like superfamily)